MFVVCNLSPVTFYLSQAFKPMDENSSKEIIERKIFLIRGHRVMLDRDLAELYGVETRVLNQAVRRNDDRFPEDFMFQLTREETVSLRSQFVTLKRGQHRKYATYVFTEQGVAMLSSVLCSKRAIQVNIAIMRVFVRLKQMIALNQEFTLKLELLEKKIATHDEEIRNIFEAIRQLMIPLAQPRRRIGFHAD
jgi:hypothetical protein